MENMQNLVKKIGSWLFLVGILLAVVLGIVFAADSTLLAEYTSTVYTLLAVLGFVVGVLSFLAIGNITHERIPTFLIATLILVGIGATGQAFANVDIIGTYFANIAFTIAIFAAPAAGLLAIRAIWDAGKTEDIEKVIPKINNK